MTIMVKLSYHRTSTSSNHQGQQWN